MKNAALLWLLLVTTTEKPVLTSPSGMLRKIRLFSTNVLGWVLGEDSKLGRRAGGQHQEVSFTLSLF